LPIEFGQVTGNLFAAKYFNFIEGYSLGSATSALISMGRSLEHWQTSTTEYSPTSRFFHEYNHHTLTLQRLQNPIKTDIVPKLKRHHERAIPSHSPNQTADSSVQLLGVNSLNRRDPLGYGGRENRS
jgi:hypothetical protein